MFISRKRLKQLEGRLEGRLEGLEGHARHLRDQILLLHRYLAIGPAGERCQSDGSPGVTLREMYAAFEATHTCKEASRTWVVNPCYIGKEK